MVTTVNIESIEHHTKIEREPFRALLIYSVLRPFCTSGRRARAGAGGCGTKCMHGRVPSCSAASLSSWSSHLPSAAATSSPTSAPTPASSAVSVAMTTFHSLTLHSRRCRLASSPYLSSIIIIFCWSWMFFSLIYFPFSFYFYLFFFHLSSLFSFEWYHYHVSN